MVYPGWAKTSTGYYGMTIELFPSVKPLGVNCQSQRTHLVHGDEFEQLN